MRNASALSLYKNLVRYGQQLQYTDKEFFLKRIRMEFKNSKNFNQKQIQHALRVNINT